MKKFIIKSFILLFFIIILVSCALSQKSKTTSQEANIIPQKAKIIHIQKVEQFILNVQKNPRGHFVLDKDIDFSQISLKKFSSNQGETSLTNITFLGTLDGQNHIIIGEKIPFKDDFDQINYGGLFNAIGSSNQEAIVKNLTLKNFQLDLSASKKAQGINVGFLAAVMNNKKSLIENVKIDASNTFKKYQNGNKECVVIVGGLIGVINNGKVTKSFNQANLVVEQQAGGIAGDLADGEIENSQNIGDIVSIDQARIFGLSTTGGIVAVMNNEKALLQNVNNAGTIISNGCSGGIIGFMQDGTIEHAQNKGDIATAYSDTGGIVGTLINGVVENATNWGSVAVASPSTGISGGIIGQIDKGFVNNDVNFGTIKGFAAGGIVGNMEPFEQTIISLSHDTNHGKIIGELISGGIVGIMNGGQVIKANNLGPVATQKKYAHGITASASGLVAVIHGGSITDSHTIPI